MSSDPRQVAVEIFLTSAGPALVKRVAELFSARGIPVMPLKGVLLQKLVYGKTTFRSISDVDLLVPEKRFLEAHATLREAGFSKSNWEVGGWQVTMKNPAGPPLGVDLHRRLTRTVRSNLTAEGMFERGVVDAHLFGTEVVLPCAEDLFAHLLLHATLHWINVGVLHRPGDFQAVADAMSLRVDRCAEHLRRQGLLTHALVLLPLLGEQVGSTFAQQLANRLNPPLRARVGARLVREICARFTKPSHPTRRFAGIAVAPSLSRALTSAVLNRL